MTDARSEWLARRKQGIGGTDAAAVVGQNPWKSALDVYVDKLDLEPEGRPEADAQVYGRIVEAAIAEYYALKQSVVLVTFPDEKLPVMHPSRPWQFASPDRIIEGQKKGVEIKNVSFRMMDAWGPPHTDQMPDYVFIQVQWCMDVFGWDEWDVCASIGGMAPQVFKVRRDRDLLRILTDMAGKFWKDNVLKHIPPDVSNRDADALKAMFKNRKKDLIEPTEEHLRLAREYVHADQALDDATEKVELVRNQLKMMIGDHDGIKGIGTWKENKLGVRPFVPSRKLEMLVKEHFKEGMIEW